MDGSGGARTAWMYKDWNKHSTGIDAGNAGYPSTDPQVYRQMVRLFHQAGVHVGTHAIGDRAIDWVVDTYAQVLERDARPPGFRHSIIHANIPTDHAHRDHGRAAERSTTPAIPRRRRPSLWWIGDTYAGNFGPERSLRLVPLKTFLNKRHPLGRRFGLSGHAARRALRAVGVGGARSTEGHVSARIRSAPPKSVDIHAALRSYTVWAARQLFLEDRIGSLEVGKDADIAVWDREHVQHAGGASSRT